MQLLLPIFPKDIKLITPNLGVIEKDRIVNYLHSGVPIGNHASNDLKSFRCHTSRMIEVGLCRQTDIVRTFGVSSDSVKRSLKLFQQKGEKGFYGQQGPMRLCHTMLPDRIKRIQEMLDLGMSNYAIAKKEGISEGTIRYSIEQGKLKKTLVLNR
jgi:transposase